jgi:hypothetical protein
VKKVVGRLVVTAAVAGIAGVAQADEPARPDFPVVVPQEAPAPAAAAPACCEQPAPAVNWTFGMSTSYTYDFNSPNTDAAPPGPLVGNNGLYANFEQDESFNIDLVQLGASGERGKLSYGAKIDYGDLARLAGDSDDGDIALQEAYIAYDFDVATATAGRFGTPVGYELLEPWGNPNVSRSWTWIAQPINHDGLKLNSSFDIVDVGVGVVNSFTVNDQPRFDGMNDTDDEKGIFANVGVSVSDAFNIYGVGLWNEFRDDVNQWLGNGIISGDIAMGDNDVNYALEGMYRKNDNNNTGSDDDMWSLAGYFGFDVGPVGVNLRGEYVDDEGILFGQDVKLWAATVTGSVELVDGVEFRVEYRHDDANEDIYLDDSNGDDTDDVIQAQLYWAP